jgi:arylsulfatase A-like enzyme
VPLAIRWPEKIAAGTVVDEFVSLTDLAPTFLAAAQAPAIADVSGRSLLPLFASDPPQRDWREHVLFGKERHVPSQEAPDNGGYPCRAIRTREFLYIRNFRPDRWPSGTPHYERAAIPGAWLADCDNGPTKTYLVEHRNDDEQHRRAYDLAFGKRPAEELYDLTGDPDQLENVAELAKYAEAKSRLAEKLMQELVSSGDPRAAGKADEFEVEPYLGGAPKHPSLK